MNLIVITNNPTRASFRQRIAVYLDTLRAQGIDCEVAKLPSGFLNRLELFKHSRNFDGVFLHKKRLNFRDAFLLRRYAGKIIYDFDDAVMYSPKAPDRSSFTHFRPFRRTVGLADMVIAGNSYLAELARRFNPNVKVLPTGLDTEAYQIKPEPKKDDKVRLAWIGSKSTLRYLAQIILALEQLASRFDNVVLRIIADDFCELQNMSVEKRRWSKETEAMDLVTSDIGLAPLPDNRFTQGKCGFKVLQYSSASLPVVASPVGVNARYVQDGITGFHAEDTSQWVDRISRLIEQPDLRDRMGKAARQAARCFDTSVIAEELTDLIKRGLSE